MLDAGALIGIERGDEKMSALLDASLKSAVRFAGVLCGLSGTSDVVDASVVISAKEHRCSVITSDPSDLGALDPSVQLHLV